jgi:hypothetical protein
VEEETIFLNISAKSSINEEICIDKLLGTARLVVHILIYEGNLRRNSLQLGKIKLQYRVLDLNIVFLRTI